MGIQWLDRIGDSFHDNKNLQNFRYKANIKEKTTEKALKMTQNHSDSHHRKP